MNKLMKARSKPDPPLVYGFLKGSVQEQATKLISQKHYGTFSFYTSRKESERTSKITWSPTKLKIGSSEYVGSKVNVEISQWRLSCRLKY